MVIFDMLMNTLILGELVLFIGAAILMQAFSVKAKGKTVHPTLPFVLLMALGQMIIPKLPQIDDPHALGWVFGQFAIFNIVIVCAGLLSMLLLSLVADNKKESAQKWPWN